jgi:hypothetical protein
MVRVLSGKRPPAFVAPGSEAISTKLRYVTRHNSPSPKGEGGAKRRVRGVTVSMCCPSPYPLPMGEGFSAEFADRFCSIFSLMGSRAGHA